MGFMDKVKFWKSEDPLKPLEPIKGFEEPSVPDLGAGEPQGPSSFDSDIGSGTDATPGLGGTPSLDNTGPSMGQEAPSLGMQETSALPSEQGFEQPSQETMYGPSYEKHQPGDLKHAPLSQKERPFTHAAPTSPGVQGPTSKDIELLSAKLDAIKASVESINHRIESIERVIMAQERKRVQW
ncbi:hypothetical protein ACFL96_14345 [Thermoproteota archaeon]